MSDRARAGPSRAPSRDDGDRDTSTRVHSDTSSERQSVSELVRNYSDPSEGQKRDRSESGDLAPAGKRGARELGGEPAHSPSTLSGRGFKERLDDAIDGLGDRLMASFSRELHEFRESLTQEISKLNDRVRDLERHVEERDGVIDRLTDDLRHSQAEVTALQTRIEDAEINSRLPCLILSGAAMAPRHSARLGAPMVGQTSPEAAGTAAATAPPDAAQGRASMTSQSADRRVATGSGQSAAGGARGGCAARDGGRDSGREDREDVNVLVVDTLNRHMPGLGLAAADIDRAHRLPGANHRVIVRFVRSGEGSLRDQIMTRRMELRGRDLYVNESLTKLRGLIFRSLLAAKRERKVFTVYSRGGQVFFKEEQHGTSKRVNSLQQLRELGFKVLDR